MKKPLRLYVTDTLAENALIEITGDQAHYLQHVMRLSIADALHLFNGHDGEWQAEVQNIRKQTVTVLLQTQLRLQTQERPLTLFFAPIKFGKIDFLAQKATELGATQFQPVITERTIVDRFKIERFIANVIEAAEQCERLNIPVVHPLKPLAEALKERSEPLIVCDETGSGQPINQLLMEKKPSSAGILIGPEGGFTKAELVMLRSLPYVMPVGLGPRIMRADTAALAALACYQACCGDWINPPSFIC